MALLSCLLENRIKTKKYTICSSSEQKSVIENISFETSMVLLCFLLSRRPSGQSSSHQFPNLVMKNRTQLLLLWDIPPSTGILWLSPALG